VTTYSLDQQWHRERERLQGIEALWDPGTKAVIERLGLAPGWRCLEVGAGAGSIAGWLADAGADVLATDIDTRFLEARPGLEVRRHDILTEPLPPASFDLVHARLVVEHLGPRALDGMVLAVRPGGWLVLEDCDWDAAAAHPDDDGSFERVGDAVLALMARSGFDPRAGRKLVSELTRAGLEDVAADGRVAVYRGGSPAAAWSRLTLEALRDRLSVPEIDIEHALARFDDPETTIVSGAVIAAWGRVRG
jgi:SAM-dependent methyltransferase